MRTTALRYLTLPHILTAPSAGTIGTGDDESVSDRASPIHACPDGLAGAWHGFLPVAPLFDMQLTVAEGSGGDFGRRPCASRRLSL